MKAFIYVVCDKYIFLYFF